MTSKLLKSTGLVGGLTLISRIAGFVRDMVAAQLFGAGSGYDAFLIAFKIPNFTRRLFAEGAFSQAFVPVLSEYRTKQGEVAVKHLINRVAAALALVLLGMTLLGILGAPLLVEIFAPGFARDARFTMATDMLRITFAYSLFISLTAFAGGILNTYGRFAVPAITPIFLNLSMIGCALWLSPLLQTPVEALAWGVLLAGLTQFLFQIPALRGLGLCPVPELRWKDPGVKKVLRLMVPAIFGASVTQINLIVDSMFASFLPVGSVSWLYYADRVLEFPIGVFGVALATVMLPNLSAHHAKQSDKAFSLTVDWALRWVVVIGIPATVGVWVLAKPILITLFQYGRYTAMDVSMTASALIAMTVGMMGYLSIKVLVSAFYAKQDTKFPVRVGIKVLILNIIFSMLFIKPFAHMGLALASSLAALFNAGLLLRELRHRGSYLPRMGWKWFAVRIVAACLCMGAFLLYGSTLLSSLVEHSFVLRFLWLLAIILGAVLVYTLCLIIFGMRRKDLRQMES